MNCQQTAELLPWHLNGTLDGAERQQIEEHLQGCDACRAELDEAEAAQVLFGGHPTPRLLLDYAAKAAGTPREIVEAHLAGCEACAEELAMALESRAELDREQTAERSANVVPLRRPARPQPVWRAAAVAAALLGLIGAGGALLSWRTLERQRDDFAERGRAAETRIAELESQIRAFERARVNVPIHDLWPDGSVLRSAGGEPARLPAEDGPAATLILNSQLEPGQEVDRLEIRDAEGRVLQILTGVRTGRGGSITMSLQLARLAGGTARILIYGPGGADPLETYSFELD